MIYVKGTKVLFFHNRNKNTSYNEEYSKKEQEVVEAIEAKDCKKLLRLKRKDSSLSAIMVGALIAKIINNVSIDKTSRAR